MNIILIFFWVILGFISMSFWEAYIEGKDPWARRQIGWKKKITEKFTLTAYHFWLYIMFFFFLTLPLIITGWSRELVGIIISAAFVGVIAEDFVWFIANPFYHLKKFNSRKAKWYPWIKIGKLEIPVIYIVAAVISLASWYFLWS